MNSRIYLVALGITFTFLNNINGANAAALADGLLNPDDQPMFVEQVINALDFAINNPLTQVSIGAYSISQQTGIIDDYGQKMNTPAWGYGETEQTASWPGPTLLARRKESFTIAWVNGLQGESHPFTSLGTTAADGSTIPEGLSVVDIGLHSAYSDLDPLTADDVNRVGVPIVTHLHGSRSDPEADGHPEAFFNPDETFTGNSFTSNVYTYGNDQPAGTLWYHDHVLGLTRLNVYAGLAGFYILRDEYDTGNKGNPLNLPTWPYEAAFAIQDRMFKKNGEFFFPAFPGEPYYDEYMEGVDLPANPGDPFYPYKGPTAFAEFFGDFMLVNGKIWPKMDVEPRKYRLRLLNACDSRFLVVSLKSGSQKLSYTIIGTDQGLLKAPIPGITSSVIETGGRLDILMDFSKYAGKRIILTNSGGDEPFNGKIPGPQTYGSTDKIMAFDVTLKKNGADVGALKTFPKYPYPLTAAPSRVRRVALFEGQDQYGRIQPTLGGQVTAGSIESLTWTMGTTENPALNSIEQWEIYNFTEDAHPVHLHLVYFSVVGRYMITFDSNTDSEGELIAGKQPAGNGVYLEKKDLDEHGGMMGSGYKATFPANYKAGKAVKLGLEFASEIGARKDIVTALPGQVTVIKALFDKAGDFVWHCHILSHEDNDMMRVLKVQ